MCFVPDSLGKPQLATTVANHGLVFGQVLSTGFSNPLAGRSAWTGSSEGYFDTTVELPSSATGNNVQLRWRFGSDTSVSSTGWRVDTIELGAPVIDTTPPVVGDVTSAKANGAYTVGEVIDG